MLEGINIGGEYRLEFLGDLKKKQEDNLKKLNKIKSELAKKNKENEEKFLPDLTEDNNINNNKIDTKLNNVKDNSIEKEKESFTYDI